MESVAIAGKSGQLGGNIDAFVPVFSVMILVFQ